MQDPNIRKRPALNKHRPRRQKAREAKTDSSVLINAGYIFTFILLILILLIYDITFLSTPDVNVDFHTLKTELVNNVHDQNEAISAIIRSLQKIEEHEEIVEAVNFIGSTGVGKTFIANILKRHFFPSVYESRGTLNNTLEKILSTIKVGNFRYNLVVFDDLTINDLDVLLVFLKKIPEDVNVLVICIFNIQETDQFLNYTVNYNHFDEIENKFNKSEIIHENAKFHEFTTDGATEWIVKQLVIKGIDEKCHSKIVESVLASQNVKYHGLKGLSSKLNLEL